MYKTPAFTLTVLLGSFLFRRPLIGVIAGALVGDAAWPTDRARMTMASIATLLWVGLFGH